eukprot:scaffold17526_cov64-Phaeocystis_antarctica.AAC.6
MLQTQARAEPVDRARSAASNWINEIAPLDRQAQAAASARPTRENAPISEREPNVSGVRAASRMRKLPVTARSDRGSGGLGLAGSGSGRRVPAPNGSGRPEPAHRAPGAETVSRQPMRDRKQGVDASSKTLTQPACA